MMKVRNMDHNYAIENHTAERYLLEELPQEERDAYEEHFFSCSVCAEEVKSASEFIESAQQVVQDDLRAEIYGKTGHHRHIWGSWLNFRSLIQPMPAMACALLVFALGFSTYQNRVTIPQLRTQAAAVQPQGTLMAQVIPANAEILSEARGTGPVITTSKDKAFTLQFDITLQGFKSYEAVITTASGDKKLLARQVSSQEAANPIHMLIPAGALPSGNYVVVIQGVNSNGTESGIKGEPVHLPFQLKIQD